MKKLMVILFMCIFLCSLVTALDFDNVKNYNEETKTVTITNAFGLGDTIAEVQLKTPLIYRVIDRGEGIEQLVAEFTINNLQNGYENALKNLEFYNAKNMNSIDKEFVYKYKYVSGKKDVKDYYEKCSKNINGTESCVKIFNGTHKEDVYSWKELEQDKFQNLPEGELTIGIFVDVSPKESVEWIPTLFGEEINEWATWTEGLNEDLRAYYAMEYDTGNPCVDSSPNSLNMTDDGVTARHQGGLIDYGFYWDGDGGTNPVDDGCSGNDWFPIDNTAPEKWSISFWFKYDTSGEFTDLIGSYDDLEFGVRISDVTLTASVDAGGSKDLTCATYDGDTSSYHHIVLQGDEDYNITGGQINFWFDGSLCDAYDIGATGFTDSSGVSQFLGGFYYAYQGYLDEVGVWNRTLTPSEISDLYNSGNGITYTISNPTVTLNNPSNGTEGVNKEITLNCSARDNSIVENVTMYLNGEVIRFETNGVNNYTSISNTTTLDYGNYNWTCLVVDDEANEIWADSNYTFTISRIIVNSINFTQNVTVGQTTTITANVTSDGSETVTAELKYNASTYSTTKNGDNTNMLFTRDVILNESYIGTNAFYFDILHGTEHINSTVNNQIVQDLNFTDCSSSIKGNLIYNFTIRDEETQNILVGTDANTTFEIDMDIKSLSGATLTNISFNRSGVNPIYICSSANFSASPLSVDALIKYGSDERVYEFYNLQNASISSANIPQVINLYPLLTADAQEFKITYKNAQFLPIADALIQVQRNYIGEGVFKTVELPITDDNGETLANLVLGDVEYTFIVTKNGQVLATFDNVLAVCDNVATGDCNINLQSSASQVSTETYQSVDDVTFTLEYLKATRTVQSIFSIAGGSTASMLLNVTLMDNLGNVTVCTDSLTSSSGTLSCVIPNSIGNATAIGELSKDGTEIAMIYIPLFPDADEIYGTSYVTLAIILFISIVGIGLSGSAVLTIFFIVIGAIVNISLYLVSGNGFIGGASTFLWLVVALLALLWKASRRNS